MLKVNLTSMQAAPLSNPVTFDRKTSTTETDATPAPQMMPAGYHYPVMYQQMMPAQAGFPQMMPVTPVNTPVMPGHPGMAPMANAGSSMSLSPTSEMSSVSSMPGLQYTYTPENLYQMTQAGTPIVPAPAQPHTYSQQAVISVKPADQMNVFETSQWVKLVAEVQGWPEAPTYAQAFYNNGVTGFMLSQLTVDDLEKYLGIEKHGHRLTLMSSIRALYPYLAAADRTMSGLSTASAAPSTTAESVSEFSEAEDNEPMSNTGSHPSLRPTNSARRRSMIVTSQALLSHNKNFESITLPRPQLLDSDSCASLTSQGSTSSIVSASSVATDTSIASSLSGDRRCQLTLLLTEAPSCNREAILSIRKTFSAAGFDAHPRPSEKAANKFIVRFQSEAEASRALLAKDQLGYKLSEYTDFPRKKGPRPTPSNPQQYMVLHHAQVRSGKSMKSKVLGFVEKGEVFWVNQIKGKRARLVERSEDGDRNMGWVSLRNNAGYQLMAPFHE